MLHSSHSHHPHTQRGFTVIELLVVAPIVILVIGAFITVIVSLTGNVLASRASSNLLFNVQDGLNRMEQDIKLSTGFLAVNNITPQTGQGFDDGTAGFQNASNANGTMLILNTIATTGNPLQASSYVYAIDPLNACNSPQVIQNTPESMNIIYFVKNGTLWRRTLMQSNYTNTTTAWCNLAWQLPSCTPGYTASFCKTQDIQIVSGLGTTGFNVTYYTGAGNTLANSAASDPGQSDSSRAAALASATTASVSLTANLTAAGRTISQSSTLRATRLDINASSIYVPPTPTIPSAPVVTASLTGSNTPTSATFTWPVVSGATGYTIDYNINGGSWINGFTNQNTRTFTVVGVRNKPLNVRVSAINTAGPSATYGTATITIPLWTPFILLNGWTNFGSGYAPAAWTQTSSGMIIMKGLVKGGSGIISSFPSGYILSTNNGLLLQTISNGAAGRLDIYASGNPNGQAGSFNVAVGNNAWFSLDGIAFMPPTTDGTNSMPSTITYTSLASTFANGWQNYTGDPTWMKASYYQDTSGRVHTEGLVSSGTTTDNTTILSLPTALLPSGYEQQGNDNGNAAGYTGIGFSGGPAPSIYAKGGGNGYVGMHTIFYPYTYTGWTTLPLVNGWVYFGPNYSTPRYTKSADGAVVVKGLIKSGTTGVAVATLPAGYCPQQELIMAVMANGAIGRIDVTADPTGTAGCSLIGYQDNATWTSLDSIIFYPG